MKQIFIGIVMGSVLALMAIDYWAMNVSMRRSI